jgi:hypothetical protein
MAGAREAEQIKYGTQKLRNIAGWAWRWLRSFKEVSQ